MNDETTPQAQDRLQEILLGYVEAAEAGAAPDPKTLLAAHPEFAKEIGEFLAGYHQLNRLATPLRENEERRSASAVIRSALRAVGAEKATTASETEDAGDRATGGADLGQLGDYRLLREIGR